jgi:hypothetical protein
VQQNFRVRAPLRVSFNDVIVRNTTPFAVLSGGPKRHSRHGLEIIFFRGSPTSLSGCAIAVSCAPL